MKIGKMNGLECQCCWCETLDSLHWFCQFRHLSVFKLLYVSHYNQYLTEYWVELLILNFFFLLYDFVGLGLLIWWTVLECPLGEFRVLLFPSLRCSKFHWILFQHFVFCLWDGMWTNFTCSLNVIQMQLG